VLNGPCPNRVVPGRASAVPCRAGPPVWPSILVHALYFPRIFLLQRTLPSPRHLHLSDALPSSQPAEARRLPATCRRREGINRSTTQGKKDRAQSKKILGQCSADDACTFWKLISIGSWIRKSASSILCSYLMSSTLKYFFFLSYN
jgi:hypothetical protein